MKTRMMKVIKKISSWKSRPSAWRLFTFDWLGLTNWGKQLQLLLTELTGVAT